MSTSASARDRHRTFACLALLLLAKLASVATLHRWGFVSVSADEFSRGLRAVRWARAPHLDSLAELMSGVWLPLEKYLNGGVLLVWRDPLRAPRATAFAFSCVLLVAVFAVARRLSKDGRVAMLASLLVVAQPWYAWLSATPALDTYWLAGYFAGLGFWLAWLDERRPRAWLWAGVWFTLASAFHYPSWIPIELTYALSVGWMARAWRGRDVAPLARSLASWALASAFLVSFVAAGWVAEGRPLAFLASHTAYSKWFYGGYDVSVAEKLAYYPRLVVTHLQPGVWLLLPFALAAALARRGERRGWLAVMPLGLAALSLAAVSVMNIGSVPATAAPGRYALFYTIVLAIYAAWGGWAWLERARARRDPWQRRLGSALALALLAWIVGADVARWRAFPPAMPPGAIAAGERLGELAASGDPSAAGATILLETRYWDFLAVQLASGLDDRVVFDRERDKLRRDLPSRLLGSADEVRELLARDRVGLVAVLDPRLKQRLGELPFLSRLEEAGGWAIFRVSG